MVKVEFGKGDFIWVGLIIVLLGVGFGYAFGGSSPAVMGHDIGELEGVCLSDGTNCDVNRSYVNRNTWDNITLDTNEFNVSCEYKWIGPWGVFHAPLVSPTRLSVDFSVNNYRLVYSSNKALSTGDHGDRAITTFERC